MQRIAWVASAVVALLGCSAGSSGGASTGGATGVPTGGVATGGTVSTGGSATGGIPSGGTSSGGTPSTGGTGTGGALGGAGGASGGAAGQAGGGSAGMIGGVAGGGAGGATGGASAGGGAGGGAGAGAAGMAGSSGGPPGGGSGVGCSGADIVCEDFEAGIDAGEWRTVGLMGPTASSARAHSGTQSALFQDEGNIGRFLAHTSGFPAGGQLYLRAFMNFANATVDMSGHTGFIVGATADTNGNELRWGQSMPGCNAPDQLLDLNHIPSDKTMCSSGHVTGGNPADNPGPGVTLAANVWYCVELYFDTRAASGGEFRIWIDDAELEVLHATADSWCPMGQTCEPPNPWPIPFSLVKFGTQVYNGGAGDIYYDDVALSTERVGCE